MVELKHKLRYILAAGTVVFVAVAFGLSGSASAIVDEPPLLAPTVVIDLPMLSVPSLPGPVEAVEILARLRECSPRQTEEVLLPWANAIADGTLTRRDALWVAAQGCVESRFVRWVLDYSCNRGVWRACDGGKAVGPFQIWDRSLIGASPEEHVRQAYAKMRANPYAWTTWKRARDQAEAWLRGDDDVPASDADAPLHGRMRIASAPAPVVAAARAYLAENADFGSEKIVEVGGRRWALVVEWHYHPLDFVGGPRGFHKGVTVFAVVE